MHSPNDTQHTMKAVRQRAFGGPDVLHYEDAPMPVLRPGEVLIRVSAIGLNPPDLYLREGYSRLPPEWRPPVAFPLILGTDVSGVIAAVAEDVDGLSPGDAVYAMVRFPSGLAGGSQAYAQYIAAPPARWRSSRPGSITCTPRARRCRC
ncbi:alcohol dehydrogenase catalytic domain-containing protein [Xanthomonas tesorieronis]|uniref:alcohol dehydrogenase catalytic domain-containing protein n=1 Tax=Xanthomonas tesorieronis TaxID=3160839 RepID=UPI0035152FC6